MDNVTDVGLVDSHAKCNCRHNDGDSAGHEFRLYPRLVAGLHTSVERFRREPLLAKVSREQL